MNCDNCEHKNRPQYEEPCKSCILESENERLTRELAEAQAEIVAMNHAAPDEVLRLTRELADAKQRISEIAYNCPSCGRHDFGLTMGPTQELLRLRKLISRWAGHGMKTHPEMCREMREAAKGEK